ncbi:MAG: glycosyltransferase family 4 protein [Phycisphaerales bacterium]|nr:glycosyltransferase family 4 protein [Phycisphaerales bacterium]MCB9864240.1 glycosyltransferase family 4 protein [Phycisphaerales bacterium]
MNVLHFAHSFIPQYGGTTTRLINLLSDPRHTHTICVPMPKIDGDIPIEQQFDNISVRRVPLAPGPSISFFAANNARRLAAVVRPDDRFDVIQGHNPPPFARAGFRVAHTRNLPCIYEAHRLSFDSFGANRETPLPNSIDRWIRWMIRREERPFFERADAVIVQTEMHRRRISECFRIEPENIHVIPMGVDETLFDPSKAVVTKDEIRRRHDWDDRTVFFYNGYLGSSNGLMTLLDAARSLPTDVRKRIRIALLGRGPLQKQVEKAAAETPDLIQSLGLVPYEQMPAYYAAADVVVIPVAPIRLWDCNNPTKLLEAMAMARPVLASNVGGITELLEDGVTGITFRSGDRADLAKRMVELATSAGDLAAMGVAARRRILADRTWRQSRDALQRLYDSLV